jgi:hypothetical protein
VAVDGAAQRAEAIHVLGDQGRASVRARRAHVTRVHGQSPRPPPAAVLDASRGATPPGFILGRPACLGP